MRTQIKMALRAALTICVTACGCSDRKSADLERRVAQLEQNLSNLTRANLEQRKANQVVIDSMVENFATMTNGLMRNSQRTTELVSSIPEEIEKLKAAVKDEILSETRSAQLPQRARVAMQQQVPARAIGLKGGVPTAIYDQIAAEAAKEWPGNFEMQDYVIESQIKAYKKLRGVQ